ILLRRREDHARRRLGRRLAHLDIIGRADAGIGALQAVEADDVDALVLAVRADRARGRGPPAGDLDHIALGQPESVHQRIGKPCETAPAVRRRQARDLDLAALGAFDRVCFRHLLSWDPPSYRMRNGAAPARVQFPNQYLIDPAILRTTARGAKRVLAAPILLTHPATTTARFRSRPLRPASTTSFAFIATRSNRPLPPKPATSPNSVRVGPGQRQLSLIPCGFSSSCRASVSDSTKALVAK